MGNYLVKECWKYRLILFNEGTSPNSLSTDKTEAIGARAELNYWFFKNKVKAGQLKKQCRTKMGTSNNKINSTVKEGGRGYNNNNNNNNNNNKKKKKVLFTDGLCHIMWFSIRHYVKTNFSHFTPQVELKLH